MSNLIPEKYRVLALVLAVLLALAVAAGAGAMVNGWRLDAAHQVALAEKQKEYEALAERVREQNRAVDAAGAAKDAADSRRELAEQYAAGILGRIGKRGAGLDTSKAEDCKQLLQEQWGAWK